MGPWTHVDGSSGAGLPRDGVPALERDRAALVRPLAARGSTRTSADPAGHAVRATARPLQDPARLARPAPEAASPLPARRRPDTRPAPGRQAPPLSLPPGPGGGDLHRSATVQWTAGLATRCRARTTTAPTSAGSAVYTTKPLRRKLQPLGPDPRRRWVKTSAARRGGHRAGEGRRSRRQGDRAHGRLARRQLPGASTLRAAAMSARAGARTCAARATGRCCSRGTRSPAPRVLPVARRGDPGAAGRDLPHPAPSCSAGHRLRITVSGGDFPHQMPPLPQPTGSLAGRVQVLTEPGHASYIELPAIHRHCGKRCRPLAVPNLIRGGG